MGIDEEKDISIHHHIKPMVGNDDKKNISIHLRIKPMLKDQKDNYGPEHFIIYHMIIYDYTRQRTTVRNSDLAL